MSLKDHIQSREDENYLLMVPIEAQLKRKEENVLRPFLCKNYCYSRRPLFKEDLLYLYLWHVLG